MHAANLLRYGLWATVAVTARRNRQEYGVPTAWLTHLAANTITLFLPDALRLRQRLAIDVPPVLQPLLRTLERRVCDDPRYAAYVAPLALGFVASHPDYSIYHGRWAERTLLGFGADSVPHAGAAYTLARLASETLLTLHEELPATHALAQPVEWAARNVDALAAATVGSVTLIWELGEFFAHYAEIAKTGRDPSEVNMQWSLPDAITDSLSNLIGLLVAIAVRRADSAQIAAAHEQVYDQAAMLRSEAVSEPSLMARTAVEW